MNNTPSTLKSFVTSKTQFAACVLISVSALLSACSTTPATPKAASAPAAINVAGDWSLIISIPQGSLNMDMAIKQTGQTFTGHMVSPQITVDSTGSVNGNELKLTYPYTVQGFAMRVDFVGTTDGQSMSGKVFAFVPAGSQVAEGTFKANRKP